jgi:nitroreductase
MVMLTRRNLLRRGLALAALPLASCGEDDYERLAATLWSPEPIAAGDVAPRALVNLATLAANSHNSQPWRFKVAAPDLIMVVPDVSRRLAVADPDDHHLWASLGCAVENICAAASAWGLEARPEFGVDTTQVRLVAAATRRDPLFDAVFARQCTRSEYDGRPLPADALRQLEDAATRPGITAVMLTSRTRVEDLLAYASEANRSQVESPAFVQELLAWLRFDGAEAVRTRDGLYSACSGNPSLPRWIAQPIFSHLFKAQAENDKLARQLRSSSGAVVLVCEHNRPEGWFEAGRAAQRFALVATALGLRMAFVNQPVEVGPVREQLARWLGAGDRRPSLVMRFGAAGATPRSLRRPLKQVLV